MKKLIVTTLFKGRVAEIEFAADTLAECINQVEAFTADFNRLVRGGKIVSVEPVAPAVAMFDLGLPELDLVDEMEWEDSDKIEFVSLEEAGLEESHAEPVFGLEGSTFSSVYEYAEWFYDNDQSALELTV